MKFEWDEEKRKTNLREHRIDFWDARRVFDGPILSRRSDRKGEVRHLVYGFLDEKEVVIVCTFRGEDCRLISARAARRDERRKYHGRISGRSKVWED